MLSHCFFWIHSVAKGCIKIRRTKLMKIGYARVSTDDQNLDLQMDALSRAGCQHIFTDQGVSGSTIEREGLSQAIAAVGKGDVLVVWKLDRLGRSLSFLI